MTRQRFFGLGLSASKYVGICTGASFDCSFARPFRKDARDPLPHPCAGVKPLCAAHQKLIIICVRMADVSNHGKVLARGFEALNMHTAPIPMAPWRS